MANGLAFDHQGRLIACESATSHVTRTNLDETVVTIASHFESRELNSPNDVVVKSSGSIYFTDPAGGRSLPHGVEREHELPFQGVFRLDPQEAEPSLLAADFDTPNGLCFSPDERLLYVNDSIRMHIRAFDVRDDGSLEHGRALFVQTGHTPDVRQIGEVLRRTGRFEHCLPDGMKADERGNVYCTGHGGTWVISPEAVLIGVISTPEIPANLAWGAVDGRSLFICELVRSIAFR